MPHSTSTSATARPANPLRLLHHHLRRRHERHYRDSHFHLWADVLLATAVIALLAIIGWLVVWQPGTSFFIDISAESSRIASGRPERFVIAYRNEEAYPIEAAEIAISLPEHFSLTSASPETGFDAASQTFRLGRLEAGERGQVVISGIALGSVGDRQAIGAMLSYRDKQASRTALASYAYVIDESVLRLELDAPSEANVGAPFDATLRLVNTGAAAVENVEIVFPELEWGVEGISHPIIDNRLSGVQLEPEETLQLEFSAIGQTEGSRNFTVEVLIKSETAAFTQITHTRLLEVAGPTLEVQASIREAALDGRVPKATIDLTLKNAGQAAMEDISLTVVSRRESLRLSRLLAVTPGLSVRGDQIISDTVLAPGAAATFSFAAELERVSVEFEEYAALVVRLVYTLEGEHPRSHVIAIPRRNVSSSITLEAGGYYYGPQGDQLGVGPIPPKVDIPTTYWVIWQIHNLGNDVGEIEVAGDLPGSAVWVDQSSLTSGTISYAPATKRVTWKPETINRTGGSYRASFAVSVLPRRADVGNLLPLVNSIYLTGRDAHTGSAIRLSAPTITTAIETDSRSAGKGKVEILE